MKFLFLYYIQERGEEMFYHLIIVLPRFAVVYRCPTMTISFEKNYDIRTGIRNSFSPNDGAINLVSLYSIVVM